MCFPPQSTGKNQYCFPHQSMNFAFFYCNQQANFVIFFLQPIGKFQNSLKGPIDKVHDFFSDDWLTNFTFFLWQLNESSATVFPQPTDKFQGMMLLLPIFRIDVFFLATDWQNLRVFSPRSWSTNFTIFFLLSLTAEFCDFPRADSWISWFFMRPTDKFQDILLVKLEWFFLVIDAQISWFFPVTYCC